MHSFELKTTIDAKPGAVFEALTDPEHFKKWHFCTWVQTDRQTGGSLRARDENGRLFEGEIVIWNPPQRYGLLWPVPVDPDEPDEGSFLTRQDFDIAVVAGKSVLTIKIEGFPTEELAQREKNTWGGWFLEKIKKSLEMP